MSTPVVERLVPVLVEAVRHPELLEQQLAEFDRVVTEAHADPSFNHHAYDYATLMEALDELAAYNLAAEVPDEERCVQYMGGRSDAIALIRYALASLRVCGIELPNDI